MKRALTLLTLAVVLSLQLAATGSMHASPVRHELDGTLGALEERRGPADRVRETIEGGGFRAWVAGAIRASGHELPAEPTLPATPVPPKGRSGGLAGLSAAVQAAETVLGPTTAEELASRTDRLWGGEVVRSTVGDGPTLEEQVGDGHGTAPRADVVAAEAAAMLVAAALDRHLEELQAAAADLVPQSGSVAGCDVLDQLPYLCIGSTADNTYTESAVLLVDMGGADTYRSSAGGAPFPDPDNPGQFISVSVNVDLGEGDDVYLSPPQIQAGTQPQVLAQGASGPRAVGILVDDGGDDTYEAIAPSGPGVALVAQGSGAGVGMLADLGGNDTYTAHKGPAAGSGLLHAQGTGVQGIGLLVDQEAGDDSYVFQVPGNADGGCYIAIGQGSVVTGAGILSDGGGRDRFHFDGSAESTFGFKDNPDFVGGSWFCPTSSTPGLITFVQASMFGQGAAFLLTGEGDTEYRAEQHAVGPVGIFGLNAQAAGATIQSPTAVLDDRGGDDVYLAEATKLSDATVVVDDSCEDCDSIVVSRENSPASGVRAQAVAQGLVWDHGDGADAYRASFETSVRLHVSEARVPAEQPLSSVDARAIGDYRPQVRAQGADSMGTTTWHPLGGLVDEGGPDAYAVRAANLATVTTNSPATVRARAYTFWRPEVTAQGAAGALLDLGGNGDTFSVTSEGRASAPDPADEFSLARQTARVHAYGGGRFVALGTDPVIEAHPYTAPCVHSSPGYRGHGWWADSCGSGQAGLGWAGPSAARAPTLTFAEPPPSVVRIGERVPLSARLLDPDGRPEPGAEIHFVLRRGVHEILAVVQDPLDSVGLDDPWTHWDTWHATAVADEKGVARASLPVETLRLGTNLSPDWRWSLVAIYDGDGRALFPQQVSADVQLGD